MLSRNYKKKKINQNETIKSNTKVSESNSRVNTKLEKIPEEEVFL